jgi:hypothetical protein
MMTAHVNKEEVVLRFEAASNLPRQQWEMLLDQLRSEHIPGLYQTGRRSHADIEPGTGMTRVTIYLTPKTATVNQAKDVLLHWGIEVPEDGESR